MDVGDVFEVWDKGEKSVDDLGVYLGNSYSVCSRAVAKDACDSSLDGAVIHDAGGGGPRIS
jgi:hypothetical protein